ncbi:hypothetical protein PLESTB_000592600 [Pleodorina starrii]|uniref:Uncharacterized protein n=1 Tax=Pleodorina starrii TaxID=330485 RepID=A0A9W6F0Y8_9CHLO|nr:hypothetical protein PLESTM_000765700 [Pleodorina starrii]GLC52184.1 hypothetical protein PLESTB_000592600 [Pleodorina starrii]GLC75814.1 hypothetical protein PLESTF_001690600 [Pleodorina starrii]
MRSIRSTSHGRCHRVSRSITCRAQRLQSGLGSITSALWERAGSVLRQLVVQKAEVQSETDLETAPPAGKAEAGGDVGGIAADAAAVNNSAAVKESISGISGGSSSSSSPGGDGSGGSGGGYTALASVRARGPLRLEVRVVDSISKVPRAEWDSVVSSCGSGELNPFLLWSFLHALEESGSAAPRTGWLPQHILVRQLDEPGADGESGSGAASPSPSPSSRLVGCVPMYLKGHSYGEYVFDSSWADFASMMGSRYYPKLQAAVPFTPVTGPRLMVSSCLPPADREAVVRALGRTLIDMTESLGVSGVHLTFTTAQEWAVLGELGFKQRLGIQFHWDNNGYDTFEDFLGELKQSKRKSIRQERKSLERAGLSVRRLPGSCLGPGHWDRFHDFYLSTVDRKWGNAYLTREFFHRLGEELADRVLLVVASESDDGAPSPSPSSPPPPPPGQLVAAALNLVGSHALFGRHWGQAEGRDVRNLHFELCYYQALEEAISRRLPRVEAGAQGEHKLQRGYLPSFTYSCHYLRDPRLGSAVDRFLQRERGQIEYTLQMMSVASSPYKKERTLESLLSKLQAYRSLSSASSGSSWEEEEEAEEKVEKVEGKVEVEASSGGGRDGNRAG